jgi:HTH-type transcriptional regulator / antitoxin HipB
MPTLTARKLPDIAAVIKAAREDAGLSQSELAERLVFSRDYMVDLESGRGNLYTSRLFRVLHRLGITVTLTYGEAPVGAPATD